MDELEKHVGGSQVDDFRIERFIAPKRLDEKGRLFLSPNHQREAVMRRFYRQLPDFTDQEMVETFDGLHGEQFGVMVSEFPNRIWILKRGRGNFFRLLCQAGYANQKDR